MDQLWSTCSEICIKWLNKLSSHFVKKPGSFILLFQRSVGCWLVAWPGAPAGAWSPDYCQPPTWPAPADQLQTSPAPLLQPPWQSLWLASVPGSTSMSADRSGRHSCFGVQFKAYLVWFWRIFVVEKCAFWPEPLKTVQQFLRKSSPIPTLPN